MQEQQGAVEMMRCQLNYRQSVQKDERAGALEDSAKENSETNKLFWLLRIKTCWWERQGTGVMG